jgi:hypothetical protein
MACLVKRLVTDEVAILGSAWSKLWCCVTLFGNTCGRTMHPDTHAHTHICMCTYYVNNLVRSVTIQDVTMTLHSSVTILGPETESDKVSASCSFLHASGAMTLTPVTTPGIPQPGAQASSQQPSTAIS